MLSDNKSCVKAREGSVEALFSQTCVLFVEEQRRALGTFYMNALTVSGFEDNFGNMWLVTYSTVQHTCRIEMLDRN